MLALPRPATKELVAHQSSALLDRCLRLFIPVGVQDPVRHSKPLAKLADRFGFGSAFRAKAMIDRRCFDLERARLCGEQGEVQDCRLLPETAIPIVVP